MNIPKPNGQRCVYCGKPVQEWEACVAFKPKGYKFWVFSHFECTHPKTKEADTGVRFK